MPLINVPVGFVELYCLVLLRVTGLLLMLPVFGSLQLSRIIKVGLISSFTLALTIGLAQNQPEIPLAGGAFILAAIGELFFGLAAGFLVRWVAEAAVIAGQMVGFQMGFAIVNVVDPMTGSSLSLMAAFQSRLVMIIFLASGLYLPFMQAIADSYQLVPFGMMHFGVQHSRAYVDLMGQAFRVALTLGGAPIVSLMLSKVVLGIIARTVPQMNVFIVGFPLTIAVGFLVSAAMMPLFVKAVQLGFSESLNQMIGFMGSAAP